MVFGTFEPGGIVFIFGQLFALAVSCSRTQVAWRSQRLNLFCPEQTDHLLIVGLLGLLSS